LNQRVASAIYAGIYIASFISPRNLCGIQSDLNRVRNSGLGSMVAAEGKPLCKGCHSGPVSQPGPDSAPGLQSYASGRVTLYFPDGVAPESIDEAFSEPLPDDGHRFVQGGLGMYEFRDGLVVSMSPRATRLETRKHYSYFDDEALKRRMRGMPTHCTRVVHGDKRAYFLEGAYAVMVFDYPRFFDETPVMTGITPVTI